MSSPIVLSAAAVVLLALPSQPVLAQAARSTTPLPARAAGAPQSILSDQAHVIADSMATRIQSALRRIATTTGGEVMVVTLPDLGGQTVDDVAMRIVSGGKDAAGGATIFGGTLVLVIPKQTSKDGQGHCQVGVGIAARKVVDNDAARSLCAVAIPSFRTSDYGGGIANLVDELARIYQAKREL